MARTDARSGPTTRARISQAATRLFLDRGFDAVTVAEVAREAGVSSVTVFKHFPRKEDLLLDRAEDAAELLRTAVRDRPDGTDVLASLRGAVLALAEDRLPFSGLAEASVPFLRTVAASSALVARAREVAADLQRVLAEEVEHDGATAGDAALLAAFFLAGYTTVFVENARRLLAGEPSDAVAQDHGPRLERLFAALERGVARPPADAG